MGWSNAGEVTVQRLTEPMEPLQCLRFVWGSSGAGAMLNMREPINGVLSHFVSTATGGIVNYNIRLHSRYDVDVLNDLATNLSFGETTEKAIYKLLDGSDRPRSIVVMGPHLFRMSTLITIKGVLDLFYWSDFAMALERRVVY